MSAIEKCNSCISFSCYRIFWVCPVFCSINNTDEDLEAKSKTTCLGFEKMVEVIELERKLFHAFWSFKQSL